MKMDIPEYAKGDQELWTPKLVREALADAFRLLWRTAGPVGPNRLKAFWPEYVSEYPPEVPKTVPFNRQMTITRMEMILLGWKDINGVLQPAWLQGPLLGMVEREKLEAWVFAELRGESDRDLCERKGWAMATFKRHRDRAAAAIGARLNGSRVQPW